MRDKSQKPLMLSDSTNQTVGTKFKGQLFKLMIMLENTSPHFIRCIKPNSKPCKGLCGSWNHGNEEEDDLGTRVLCYGCLELALRLLVVDYVNMARGAGVSGRGRGRGRGEAAIEPFVGPQPEVEGTGAGLAGVGAGGHVGAEGPRALGAAAGVARGPDGGVADLLRQLLERIPAVVPVQAPIAPRVAEVQPRVAVAGGAPSYIKMMGAVAEDWYRVFFW
ncbi:Myosin head motor domain [Arabidopsis thaliana x Arabidopsis arenosa]|uniref:Myosin head motor domain n=1 Tax=Arabidopsis thaliana x Arabidopsis arenosa TaxID=1240361 RepID=A0A8T1XH61_9BRAS|nr:Myosin head motor domain [Arabidopsis thaliana x Arabidopsis arenosa]